MINDLALTTKCPKFVICQVSLKISHGKRIVRIQSNFSPLSNFKTFCVKLIKFSFSILNILKYAFNLVLGSHQIFLYHHNTKLFYYNYAQFFLIILYVSFLNYAANKYIFLNKSTIKSLFY